MKLATGVAALALLVGTSAASAQNINQDTDNSGTVSLPEQSITVNGALQGLGSSTSISSNGATSSVLYEAINANFITPPVNNITQETDNTGNITTQGGTISISSNITGDAASASVSASGAVSSVSVVGLGTVLKTPVSINNIDQTTTNDANTANGSVSTSEINVNSISGDGSTASVSATGAGSSVSGSFVGAGGGSVTIASITQDTELEVGHTVSNIGVIDNTANGNISGDGASVSVSAIGAVSSVSLSFISQAASPSFSVGPITQTTTNENDGSVTNTGAISDRNAFALTLSGPGTSASISATGAASAVSARFINSPEVGTIAFGNIDQTTDNQSGSLVINNHKGQTGSGPGSGGVMNLGAVSGNGASASISATGAISSVSISSIDNTNVGGTPSITLGSITQNTTNDGNVTNRGQQADSGSIADHSIVATSISGPGASVSISASGAVSSIAISSINDVQALGSPTIGAISQTTENTATILNNSASITTGTISGAGAAASISAVGAASAVSFSAIN